MDQTRHRGVAVRLADGSKECLDGSMAAAIKQLTADVERSNMQQNAGIGSCKAGELKGEVRVQFTMVKKRSRAYR